MAIITMATVADLADALWDSTATSAAARILRIPGSLAFVLPLLRLSIRTDAACRENYGR
jgi:hypothetical protein